MFQQFSKFNLHMNWCIACQTMPIMNIKWIEKLVSFEDISASKKLNFRFFKNC